MKAKTIISTIAVIAMLQPGVSAAEISSYGQAQTGGQQVFAEKEFIVTLDANGGFLGDGYVGTKPEITLITHKGRIKLPIPYWNSDYEFEGWYTEDEEKVSSKTVYFADAVLYAKWDIIGTRTLTFSSDGGSDVAPMTGMYGSTVNIENYVPTKAGYIFKGWYTDPRTKENQVREITFDENKTVYAKWEQTAQNHISIGKDHIYMTDEEIAEKKERLQQEREPEQKLTDAQIRRLIELLKRLIQAYK